MATHKSFAWDNRPVASRHTYSQKPESVSTGHPDKLADQILRTACSMRFVCRGSVTAAWPARRMVTTGHGHHRWRDHHQTRSIDYPGVVRRVIREVGYTDDAMGISGRHLRRHSASIGPAKAPTSKLKASTQTAGAGKDIGAGDQGLMFGYACRDTPGIDAAARIALVAIAFSTNRPNRVRQIRRGKCNWLRPGQPRAKSRSSTKGTAPMRIDTVVVSTQHAPGRKPTRRLRKYVIENDHPLRRSPRSW